MSPFTLILFGQSDGGVASGLTELGDAPYWVLAAYLLLLLVLGLAGWLRSKAGEEDYYLASRGQKWVISSLTIMATFFSSFALLGAPGMVYREGVVFALFALNVPVGGLCVYLLGARIWKLGRKFGYVTPGDMAAHYYGNGFSLRILVAITGVLYAIPYVVMQIKAGGVVSQQLFGGENSFTIGATVLAGITMLYIMVGGMRSVAWTDVVQGLLLISGMLVGGMAMLLLFNGPAEFSRRVVTELPDSSLTAPGNQGYWTWTMLLSVCILASSGSMVQPAQWMRYYSASNAQTLKRAAVIFALVLTACFLLGVMLIGMAGQVFYPLRYEVAQPVEDWPDDWRDQNGDFTDVLSEQLAEHVRFQPPETDAKDSGGTIYWGWDIRKQPSMTNEDVQSLSQLSASPEFQKAIKDLRGKVADRQTKPVLKPNRTVDPHGKGDFDSILVVMLTKKMPAVLGQFGAVFASVLIIAVMAASMSTADSNLHALSALVTRDVYDQFIRPQASEREKVWVGRFVIFLATAVSLGVVILGSSPAIATKYDFLQMIATMGLMAIAFSSQLLPMAIDILYLRKGTGAGAAAGLAAGLLVVFVTGPLFEILLSATFPETAAPIKENILGSIARLKFVPMHGSVWGLLVNVPTFALVSLITRKVSPQRKAEVKKVVEA